MKHQSEKLGDIDSFVDDIDSDRQPVDVAPQVKIGFPRTWDSVEVWWVKFWTVISDTPSLISISYEKVDEFPVLVK